METINIFNCSACGTYHRELAILHNFHPGRDVVLCPNTGSEISITREKSGLYCYGCGRPYGDEYGFPDLVVPNEIWGQISPTHDEGGLLCPSCICKRAYDAGIINATAIFRSGPFAQV